MEINFNPKKNLEYELSVGQNLIFKTSGIIFWTSHGITYAGMPSKEVFSLFQYDGEITSPNFYIPISKKEIILYNNRFEILNVDPERIKLKYLRS